MTTRVITITEDQTKQEAARLLSQHRISGLPVVNANHVVVGVVTEYDVIGVSISKREKCTLSKTGGHADLLIWLPKRIEERG
jgi:CBS domain-containing protein